MFRYYLKIISNREYFEVLYGKYDFNICNYPYLQS